MKVVVFESIVGRDVVSIENPFEGAIIDVETTEQGTLKVTVEDVDGNQIDWAIYSNGAWLHVQMTEPPTPEVVASVTERLKREDQERKRGMRR